MDIIIISIVIITVAKSIDFLYYHLYLKGKQTEFEAKIMSPEEKLSLINIEELKVCYGTSIISNFKLEKAKLILTSGQMLGFEINDVIIQNNSIFIKIKYSLPYNNGKNEYGTCFIINYIENTENTENIEVYGFNTFISNEKEAFNSIAKEIISQLSK
jgi:hypothetical protein